MSTPSFPPRTNRILTGIAVSVALHLLLLWGWRMAMRVPAQPDSRRASIDWIEVRLTRPAQGAGDAGNAEGRQASAPQQSPRAPANGAADARHCG